MARIGIIGSEGRMGHALVRAIEAAGHECAGGVDRGGDAAALADHSDALLDFSAPAALEGNLHAAVGAYGPFDPRQKLHNCSALLVQLRPAVG